MDEYDKKAIDKPLSQLASANSDSLRAAQRLFAQLIGRDNQKEALGYAIEAFTKLNIPQRIQLLREVECHLTQNRYECLAFENNARFLTCILDQLTVEMARVKEVQDTGLLGWFRKIHAEAQREPAHGSPEHVKEVTEIIKMIKTLIKSVSVESETLTLSHQFNSFLETLNDNQLSRLILFVTDIRNIRACRNRFTEVADKDYIDQKVGIKDGDLAIFGFTNPLQNLHDYLRAAPNIVQEIADMDFVKLSMLIDHISNFRSCQFKQGRTNQ